MKKIATILMLAVMACPAWADLIVQYDIAEADGIEAQTAAMASHVAASALGVVGARVPNSSQAIPGTVMARRWSTDSSPDPAKYLEFSVSADPGYLVSYDSVTLGLFRSYRRAGRYGAESWDLRASTDGFSSSDVFLSSFDISGSASNEQVVFSDVDISVLGTQSSTVSFRLYGYDAAGNNNFSGLSNEDGTSLGGSGSDLMLGGLVAPASPLPEPITIRGVST